MSVIRYRERYEIDNLAGLSVAEARHQYRGKFGIPDKAVAKLNGKKIKESLEVMTCLCYGDELSFSKVRSRGALIIVVVLPLVLALTCAMFAYGFVNNTATVMISSADANFAGVTTNTSTQPIMKVFGSFKGSIGASDLFNIEPAAGFPGSLVVTLSLTNADKLVKYYRVMTLLIEARDSSDTIVDINLDTYKNKEDYVLLTLNNGEVYVYLPGSDNYTIKLKGGYYVSNTYSSDWSSGSPSPIIYCDIDHR